ncbi:unnamed protein product [Closterium sp. NIES-64]|nr:unnamed protein product [Closterium sp. NIES-64]
MFAVFRKDGERALAMISKYHTVAALKEVYVTPWKLIDPTSVKPDGTTLPPKYKKKSGRPPKKRLRSHGELDPKRLRKCKKCSEYGHNSRTCEVRAASRAMWEALMTPEGQLHAQTVTSVDGTVRTISCRACGGRHGREVICEPLRREGTGQDDDGEGSSGDELEDITDEVCDDSSDEDNVEGGNVAHVIFTRSHAGLEIHAQATATTPEGNQGQGQQPVVEESPNLVQVGTQESSAAVEMEVVDSGVPCRDDTVGAAVMHGRGSRESVAARRLRRLQCLKIQREVVDPGSMEGSGLDPQEEEPLLPRSRGTSRRGRGSSEAGGRAGRGNGRRGTARGVWQQGRGVGVGQQGRGVGVGQQGRGVGVGQQGRGVGVGQPGTSVGVGQQGRSVGVGQPGTSVGVGQQGRSVGVGQPGTSVGVGQQARSVGVGQPGTSVGVGQQGRSVGVGQPGTSVGVGQQGRSVGVGQPGTSVGVGQQGRSVGVGQPGTSVGVGQPGRGVMVQPGLVQQGRGVAMQQHSGGVTMGQTGGGQQGSGVTTGQQGTGGVMGLQGSGLATGQQWSGLGMGQTGGGQQGSGVTTGQQGTGGVMGLQGSGLATGQQWSGLGMGQTGGGQQGSGVTTGQQGTGGVMGLQGSGLATGQQWSGLGMGQTGGGQQGSGVTTGQQGTGGVMGLQGSGLATGQQWRGVGMMQPGREVDMDRYRFVGMQQRWWGEGGEHEERVRSGRVAAREWVGREQQGSGVSVGRKGEECVLGTEGEE